MAPLQSSRRRIVRHLTTNPSICTIIAMTTSHNSNHFAEQQGFQPTPFDLEEVYDRIVVEGQYFDYPSAAKHIGSILGGGARILELCVGTGNLANELALAGHPVTGLDRSPKMLDEFKSRPDAASIELVAGDATSFSLPELYDAVVIHSGHIIINRIEDGTLRLNGPSERAMQGTVESASRHLAVGGKLILNIEQWNDKAIPYPDGSIYIRRIKEEAERYGSRVHVFYDKPRNKVAAEIIIREPKIPFEAFLRELGAQGLGAFTEHVPTDPYGGSEPGAPTLFSATKLA